MEMMEEECIWEMGFACFEKEDCCMREKRVKTKMGPGGEGVLVKPDCLLWGGSSLNGGENARCHVG